MTGTQNLGALRLLHEPRGRLFLLFCLGVGWAMLATLQAWLALALRNSLHSHIVLIPLVSAYLAWLKRERFPGAAGSAPVSAAAIFCLGLAALLAGRLLAAPDIALPASDILSLRVAAIVTMLIGAVPLFFGEAALRVMAFPLLFLFFAVPLPSALVDAAETALQVSSAWCADLLLRLTGTPFLRDGMALHLPGLSVHVAPECSGIRSTLVLFITSLLAGHLFLRRAANRLLLALIVYPLGVLRNGLRIVTISMLAAYVDRGILRSPLHSRGGTPFFILSLIPFFFLLIWLRRHEATEKTSTPSDRRSA